MEYLCLVYLDGKQFDGVSKDELAAIDGSSLAYDEELRRRGHLVAARALAGPQTAASVRPRAGGATMTDGPFVETKEHLGGFAVVDVPGDAEARHWAGRIAVAVGWPQGVHRFPHRIASSADTQSEALSLTAML